MKLSELVKETKLHLEQFGDKDVVIDVEARCFNYHYVDITKCQTIENTIADANIIEGKNDFVLYPSYYNAPCNLGDNDLEDLLKNLRTEIESLQLLQFKDIKKDNLLNINYEERIKGLQNLYDKMLSER